MSRRKYLVTYDVADDKRRRLAYRALLDFGDHAQYSVFLCELNNLEILRLRSRLHDIIHHTEDQILVTDLGPAGGEEAWREIAFCIGRPLAPPSRTFIV